MNNYFRLLTLSACFFVLSPAMAQVSETRQIKEFRKIIVSPLVDLVLIHGEAPAVRLEVNNTTLDKVNTKVRGGTLKIFLDGARITVKEKKHFRKKRDNGPDVIFKRREYENARVTAYVTYTELNNLQVRGEGYVKNEDKITADRFKLKLYGDMDVNLAYLKASRLKAALYGENSVKIEAGSATKQVYTSYGENTFNAVRFPGTIARTSLFGESKLRLNIDRRIRVSSLGESNIYFVGRPIIRRRIILGETEFRRLR